MTVHRIAAAFLIATATISSPAFAQASQQTASPAATAKDDPSALVPAEPDFVVINLPTAMRAPLFKGNFRLTHRFGGNLRRGSFGDQLGNLFGLDQGAIIGIEYRVGLGKDLQAAFHRSSFEKTIEFYGKYDGIRQRGSMPVSLSAVVSIEGTNNFKDKFSPAAGVVISRRVGTRAAAYLTPMWTSNPVASFEPIEHEHGDAQPHADGAGAPRRNTFYTGIGGRFRIGGTTYVAAEVVIRASGYAPDRPAYGFSLEKRAGGHMFSLTFTNTFGTTLAQLARGGAANSLYLGFNLGRKFF